MPRSGFVDGFVSIRDRVEELAKRERDALVEIDRLKALNAQLLAGLSQACEIAEYAVRRVRLGTHDREEAMVLDLYDVRLLELKKLREQR